MDHVLRDRIAHAAVAYHDAYPQYSLEHCIEVAILEDMILNGECVSDLRVKRVLGFQSDSEDWVEIRQDGKKGN